MQVAASSANDIHSIMFVHNALPDLSMDDINLECSLNYGKSELVLSFPAVVLLDDEKKAQEMSKKDKELVFCHLSKDSIVAFSAGKEHVLPAASYNLVQVNNGIEIAKAYRASRSNLPFINESQLSKVKEFTKQLRIAMFLTNSRNIGELREAPAYRL